MEINQLKQLKVDAKTISLCLKVRDQFSYTIQDAQGEVIHQQEDGYVPDFMPGEHYGDYVMLDIDIETGQIKNWKKLDASNIAAVLIPKEDD